MRTFAFSLEKWSPPPPPRCWGDGIAIIVGGIFVRWNAHVCFGVVLLLLAQLDKQLTRLWKQQLRTSNDYFRFVLGQCCPSNS